MFLVTSPPAGAQEAFSDTMDLLPLVHPVHWLAIELGFGRTCQAACSRI